MTASIGPGGRAASALVLAALLAPAAARSAPGDGAAAPPLAGHRDGVWIKKYPGEYAAFKLETAGGLRIIADPYALDETVAPDLVTESHQDPDHTDLSRLRGAFTLLQTPGEYLVKGIRITGIAGKHNKPDRGVTNTIFVFEVEGVRIAHLASQGALLDDSTVSRLEGVDVLMIQGTMSEFFREQKLTGEDCRRIVDRLHPRIVIPEHGTPRIGEYIARRLHTTVEYAPPEGIVVTRADLDRIESPRIVDMDRKESSR